MGPISIIVRFSFFPATFSCSGAGTGKAARAWDGLCQHILQEEKRPRTLDINKGAMSVMGHGILVGKESYLGIM